MTEKRTRNMFKPWPLVVLVGNLQCQGTIPPFKRHNLTFSDKLFINDIFLNYLVCFLPIYPHVCLTSICLSNDASFTSFINNVVKCQKVRDYSRSRDFYWINCSSGTLNRWQVPDIKYIEKDDGEIFITLAYYRNRILSQ